jgi:hypothetical protein
LITNRFPGKWKGLRGLSPTSPGESVAKMQELPNNVPAINDDIICIVFMV